MEKVNELSPELFVDRFSNVIYDPRAARAVIEHRPFSSMEHVHQRFSSYLDGLSATEKGAVLKRFPDLARLSPEQNLSKESTREHKIAGLDDLTDVEEMALRGFNRQYKDKFGFPFVICARLNKKKAVLEGIERRLQNDIENELYQGIEEVKKICLLRVEDIIRQLQKQPNL